MCYCPAKHFFGQSIKRGHFPKWNPYIYSGHPFSPFGGGQSSDLGQLLTKFRPLFIPVERTLGYVAALCLILAGFLMYAFLREPRGSVYGWLPAAVIFLFNANTIAWLEFPAHQSVQLWIPLVFLLFNRALRLCSGQALTREPGLCRADGCLPWVAAFQLASITGGIRSFGAGGLRA